MIYCIIFTIFFSLMQLNQRDKKQTLSSQLLASLSQILKLYHKYLSFLLREDLPWDRKAGHIQNIRDRVSIISEKYLDLEINNEKYENKLVQRFLNRLNEKIKGYVDQYIGKEIPIILLTNLEIVEQIDSNFRLSQLLGRLFRFKKQYRVIKPKEQQVQYQKDKDFYKSASTSNTVQQNYNKILSYSTVQEVQKNIQKAEKVQKIPIFKTFAKRSAQIQQNISLINILSIDEKELRKKYFTAFQHISQMQMQQNESKSAKNSKNKPKLTEDDNPLIIEQIERNKCIKEMIRKYEQKYNKYKMKEQVKQKKQRQIEIQLSQGRSAQMPEDKMLKKSSQQKLQQVKKVIRRQKLSISNYQRVPSNPHEEPGQSQQRKLPPKNSNKQLTTLNKPKNKESSFKTLNFKSEIVHQQENCLQQLKINDNSLPQLKVTQQSSTPNSSNNNHMSMLYNSHHSTNINGSKRDKLVKIQKIQQIMNRAEQNYKGYKNKSHSTSILNNMELYTESQINLQINNCNNSNNDSEELGLGNQVGSKYKYINKRRHRHHGSSIIHTKQGFEKIVANTKSQNNHHHLFSRHDTVIDLGNDDQKTMNKVQLISVNKMIELSTTQNKSKEIDGGGSNIANHNPSIIHLNSIGSEVKSNRLNRKHSILYKEIEEKRMKIQAYYNKVRPAQIGILSKSNQLVNSKILQEEQQKQVLLMACKSYQQSQTDPNNTNLKDIKMSRRQQIIHHSTNGNNN